MESTAVRVVDWIDGAVNLRDVGGYPTEDGRRARSAVLFRSGATGAISRAGLARVADELRIRTVIDLRSEKERQRSLSPFEEHGIDVVHEPLDPGSGISPGAPSASMLARMAQGELDWVELYWSLIQRNGDRFARIIDLLGRPGTLPVLIHCTGGRDRTGVTVALIQAALGISAANIAEDYALSSPLLELAPVAEFERLFGSFDIPREEIVRAMVTRPDTMHALFARVRGVYGDVDGLLRAIGLDREALDRLRAAVCA